MTPNEIAAFVATAAASGVIGNRMDSYVASLGAVKRLHSWLQERLIDPVKVQPSPSVLSWASRLSEGDRDELGQLMRDAVEAAGNRAIAIPGGAYLENSHNSGTVIGTQNNFAPAEVNEWEYATVEYGQEGDFTRPGLKWVAYINRPGSTRSDIRDYAQIKDVLNELGREGWELVSQQRIVGINTTEYSLRRKKR